MSVPEEAEIEAAIDLVRFEELAGGFDAAERADLIATFVDGAREQICELSSAAAAGDVAEVRGVAHKLCGGCMALGLPPLAEAAGRAESVSSKADLVAAAHLVSRRWAAANVALARL